MFLIRWLIKITSLIPSIFFLGFRRYFIGGKINTVAYKGPLIIVSNHRSFMDFPIMVKMFALRRVYVVVSELLYASSPFMRFILNVMGVIKADRFSGNPEFINKSIDILNKGGIVLIYPEGIIETTDELCEFKRSAALISIQTGVPILPVYHNGERGFLKKDKCFIGSLMYPQEYMSKDSSLAENADRLNGALYDTEKRLQEIYRESFFTDGRKKSAVDKMCFRGRFIRATSIKGIWQLLLPRIKYESPYAKFIRKHKKRLIVIANHTWWLDGPMLYYLLIHRFPYCVMAKDTAEKNPRLYKLQTYVNGIFIDRTGFDWAAMKSCIDVLNQDGVVIIFPEGRFITDGSLDEFHTGAAMLSALTGSPILPVYLDGIYRIFKRTGMYVGEPMSFKEYYEKNGVNSDSVNEVTQVLYRKLSGMKALVDANEKESQKALRQELEGMHIDKLKNT